jgi:hypothetical protein
MGKSELSEKENELENGHNVVVKDATVMKSDDKAVMSVVSLLEEVPLEIVGRRDTLRKEIAKGVVRKKLAKMRHLVIPQAISPAYLDSLFPSILEHFDPQTVVYNGGIANVKEWKISCYLEVMEGGIPCTHPNLPLLHTCHDLLASCNTLFIEWYRQQHSCNNKNNNPIHRSNQHEPHDGEGRMEVKRLMTFITRYTPAPGEQALLKHVDGAGKVDGSLVLALPVDRWSGPESEHTFQGGGLTFWDGVGPQELPYDTRSGDVAFIDRAVWHQANPITQGTRWALVIFYKVLS